MNIPFCQIYDEWQILPNGGIYHHIKAQGVAIISGGCNALVLMRLTILQRYRDDVR